MGMCSSLSNLPLTGKTHASAVAPSSTGRGQHVPGDCYHSRSMKANLGVSRPSTCSEVGVHGGVQLPVLPALHAEDSLVGGRACAARGRRRAETPALSLTAALATLAGITIVVAVCSECGLDFNHSLPVSKLPNSLST